MTKNEIISEINITNNDSTERIINSFENTKREYLNIDWKNYESKENEEGIKDCEIYINDIKIDFIYYYTFKNKGKYIIKYRFKKLLNSTNYMFCNCKSLSSIDLSNFNTQNVTNMQSMFSYCKSLSSLDLSNFNTQNVTNMEFMFYHCNSLSSLDLSNFNTQNVTNMEFMFYHCNSLSSLDLSNFNTQNIPNMQYMFYYCNSLIFKNIINFKNN